MKHIFITGGTTGIGFTLAERYLERGDRVGICGRNLNKLPAGVLEKYPNLKAYEADVTDHKKLKEVITEFSQNGLDVMVANAGIAVSVKESWPDFELARKVIDTNVTGVLNTFEFALEAFKQKNQGKGHLVAIASVAGRQGLPGAASYSASKAAVLKLCESFSIDLKAKGVDVTAIGPGFIDTPLTKSNKHPMPFLMSSERASRLIIKAIDYKKELYYFPWRMNLLTWISEHAPRFLYRWLMRSKIIKISA